MSLEDVNIGNPALLSITSLEKAVRFIEKHFEALVTFRTLLVYQILVATVYDNSSFLIPERDVLGYSPHCADIHSLTSMQWLEFKASQLPPHQQIQPSRNYQEVKVWQDKDGIRVEWLLLACTMYVQIN